MTDDEFIDEFGDECPYCDKVVPIPSLRDVLNDGQMCPHCFGNIGIESAERSALIERFEAIIAEVERLRLEAMF